MRKAMQPRKDMFAKRLALPEGTVVVLKEVKALPSVQVHVVIEAGSLWDPEGKEGIAVMTTEGLLTGTVRRQAKQISEEIDFTGGTLTATAGKDYVSVTLNTLKKTLPTGLDILADTLTHPVFRAEEVAKKKEEVKARIRRDEDDPGTLAQKAFVAELFDNRTYGRPLLGTEASVSALGRSQVLAYYKERLCGSRVMCTVVGQTTEDEFVSLWGKHMGSWPSAMKEAPIDAGSEGTGRCHVKKIDRDLTQANIVLGHKGIARSHPDYHAVFVMNYVLGGGGFRSRLVDNIREEKGLAYSIYSRFVSARHAGYFQVAVETKNASAGQAITEILNEMRRMKDGGVTSDELDEAKLYLTGSFPLKMDTNGKIARLLTEMEFHHLGLDYPARYPEMINAVTRDDVADAARKYLHPDDCTVAIVGKKREITWP